MSREHAFAALRELSEPLGKVFKKFQIEKVDFSVFVLQCYQICSYYIFGVGRNCVRLSQSTFFAVLGIAIAKIVKNFVR